MSVLSDNDNLFFVLIQNDDGKATKAIMTDGQSNLVGQPKFAKEIAGECFTFCTVATPSTLRSLGKKHEKTRNFIEEGFLSLGWRGMQDRA